MKPLILLLTLSPFTSYAIGADKLIHAAGAYGITHVTQAVCNRLTEGKHETACLITGIATAATAGAAKELLDQAKGRNSVKESLYDGAADVTGIGAAAIVISIDF